MLSGMKTIWTFVLFCSMIALAREGVAGDPASALGQLGTEAGAPTEQISQAMTSLPRAVTQAAPLFDAHAHFDGNLPGSFGTADALARMREAGYIGMLVSSTPNERTLQLFHAGAGFVVPELKFYIKSTSRVAWRSDPDVPKYLRQHLQEDGVRYWGIGEFHIYDKSEPTEVEKEVIEIAKENGLYLHAHCEIHGLANIFKVDPQAKVLWAHAGFVCAAICPAGVQAPPVPSADDVRAMLAAHPTLLVDLSYRDSRSAPATNLTIPQGRLNAGRLPEEWNRLIQAYPDRFLLGTDSFSADFASNRWNNVKDIADEMRGWLGGLPPETAEAVACGNASRIFGFSSDACKIP